MNQAPQDGSALHQESNQPVSADAGSGETIPTQTPGSASEAVQEQPQPTPADDWKQKWEELNDKYLRLYAEFENYKKRTLRERIELFSTASAEVVTSLLPVLDDFKRAVQSHEKTTDMEAMKKGVEILYNKIKSILEQSGLSEMDALHREFNPDIHHAVTKIPAPQKKFVGKVVEILEKGYLLNGRVIRHAKVVVGQ